MQTVRLETVLRKVASRMGTRWEDVLAEEMRQWVDWLNVRVRLAWKAFQWPQLRLTEQRYFGAGLHVPGEEYTAGETVYVAASETYWTANTTTVVDPAEPDWSEAAEPLYRLIPLDQRFQNALGDVHELYAQDPRRYPNQAPLLFDLDGEGVNVRETVDSAWVQYRQPVPMFTGERWTAGTYPAGTVLYDQDAGDCFEALEETAEPVTNATAWRRIELPEFLANAVAVGTYADALTGDGQSEKAGREEKNFQSLLAAEVKTLVHQQGQRPRVNVRSNRRACA